MDLFNTIISFVFWILLIVIIMWVIRGLILCCCPGVLDVFEENIIIQQPVEEEEVQVQMENIAGTQVVIGGFI